MGLVKVFSGSEIMVLALQEKMEAAGIKTILKNNIQSAIMAGFGLSGQAVELFIKNKDLVKANPVLEKFKMGL